MPILTVDKLESGMLLAEDLKDGVGRFLLPAGARLEDKHIAKMEAWGVGEASVDLEGQEGTADLDEQTLAAGEARIGRSFMFVDVAEEPMQDIYRISLLRAAPRPEGNWPPPEEVIAGAEDPEHPLPPDIFQKDEGTAADLIKSEVQLSSFPDIYFRIKEVLESPYSSASHVADVVSKDTSLSAKLLRLVNSPFYGFQGKIDSISRAVTLVGANELSTLALGISAINAFKDIPEQLVDMRSFWQHSITCGVLAKVLGRAVQGQQGERLFVAGLLHDLGRLVMFRRLPYASTAFLRYGRANCVPTYEAEREVVGFDHARVGGMLLKAWKFPPALVAAVRYHHNPTACPDGKTAHLVCLADVLANAMHVSTGGVQTVPPVSAQLWDALDLPLDALAPAVDEAERQVSEIVAAFLDRA